jgi:DNA invertase Pin-like site-specific DNA recombinase
MADDSSRMNRRLWGEEHEARDRRKYGGGIVRLKRRLEDAAASLTPGKLNAVRAAFRAGVTPSRIARQFGISHSDVRKALAGSVSKSAKP